MRVGRAGVGRGNISRLSAYGRRTFHFLSPAWQASHSPWILEELLGLGEAQADRFHALDGKEAAEARQEGGTPAEAGKLPADIPQPGIVFEEICVRLAKVQVVHHVGVVAIEQVLQILDGQFLVVGITDLFDPKVEQRLVVIEVAGDRVEYVPEEGGAGAPRCDHHTAHRCAVRFRCHVRQTFGAAAWILKVLHLGEDTRPLSRQDIHYSSCQIVDGRLRRLLLLLLHLLLEAVVEGAARQRIGRATVHTIPAGLSRSAASSLIPASSLVEGGCQRTVLGGGDQQQDAQAAHGADADQIGSA